MYSTEFEIIEDVLTDSENLEYKILKSFPSTSFSVRIDLKKSTHPDLSKFLEWSIFFDFNKVSYCKYDFDFPIIKRIEKLTSFKFIYFTFARCVPIGISYDNRIEYLTTLYLTFDIKDFDKSKERMHTARLNRTPWMIDFYEDDMNFGMNMLY